MIEVSYLQAPRGRPRGLVHLRKVVLVVRRRESAPVPLEGEFLKFPQSNRISCKQSHANLKCRIGDVLPGGWVNKTDSEAKKSNAEYLKD